MAFTKQAIHIDVAFLTAYGGADDEETGSVLAVERNSSEDGGVENYNSAVDELVDSGLLQRLLA